MSCVNLERLKMIQTNIQIKLRIMRQQRNSLLQSIFLSVRKLDKIQYQIYLQKQVITLKSKGVDQGNNSETYMLW